MGKLNPNRPALTKTLEKSGTINQLHEEKSPT